MKGGKTIPNVQFRTAVDPEFRMAGVKIFDALALGLHGKGMLEIPACLVVPLHSSTEKLAGGLLAREAGIAARPVHGVQ